ncbi:MAG: hypothetical protein ACD_25C00104G0001 [uncultured bacterium]|nr:MAG: hypothetical protein ACD_25C00104G0001 [uncultured bacterium]
MLGVTVSLLAMTEDPVTVKLTASGFGLVALGSIMDSLIRADGLHKV